MTRHQVIAPDSTRFLEILRYLTPLQDKAHGRWAKAAWARNLANLMGQMADEYGEDCLPWAEVDLERELRRLGTPLSEDVTITAAIDKVAAGLCAYYFTTLRSRISDGERQSREKVHDFAQNPIRDLGGVRIQKALTEPWMRTVAQTMVHVILDEPSSAGDLWPPHLFLARLQEQGHALPGFDDPESASAEDPRWVLRLELCIDVVAAKLEEANPKWFANNIEGPANRLLGGIHALHAEELT
jgi:hypothetical protein